MNRWMLLLLLFAACKKSDNTPPQVDLEIPSTSLTSFNYGESIFIRFSASDDQELAKYAVQLVDNNRKIVAGSNFKALSGTQKTISTSLELTDRHLPSNDYSLEIVVEDQSGNRGLAYSTVRYYELPLAREALLIARDLGNSTIIDSLSAGSWVQAASLDVNASIAFGADYHQLLILGGDLDAVCRFYSLPEFLGTGGFSGQNPLADQFISDIVFDQNRKSYFVSFADGWIREFSSNGGLKSAFQTSFGFLPQKLFVTEGYIICEEAAIGSQTRIVSKYNVASGVLMGSSSIPFDVVAFLETANTMYAFGNQGNESQTAILNADMSNQPADLLIEAGTLYDVEPVSNGWVAFAHQNGIVFQKPGEALFFPASANGFAAIDLDFDPANNVCFALNSSNQLASLSPFGGSILNQVETGNQSKQVIVLMNK